jgi:hypothetical protein
VFTVNTKNLSGNVWVGGDTFLQNGQRHPYVRNARHEAQRAARLLSRAAGEPVAVYGVVAVIADRFTVKEQPYDVRVVFWRHLRHWLAGCPPTIDPVTLERAAKAVRDPRTWRPA